MTNHNAQEAPETPEPHSTQDPTGKGPGRGGEVGQTSDQQKGLYAKYRVKRLDGSSDPGGKHEHCDYFVLDPEHDPFTLAALAVYIRMCHPEYPELAKDLQRKYLNHLDHDEDRCATDEPLLWCRDCQSYAASDQ